MDRFQRLRMDLLVFLVVVVGFRQVKKKNVAIFVENGMYLDGKW